MTAGTHSGWTGAEGQVCGTLGQFAEADPGRLDAVRDLERDRHRGLDLRSNSRETSVVCGCGATHIGALMVGREGRTSEGRLRKNSYYASFRRCA